jgi:hypothetical protein
MIQVQSDVRYTFARYARESEVMLNIYVVG